MNEAELYADILHEVHRWGCETRYPFLSLQSGSDNIAWGAPRWSLRAEAPRVLAQGDMVQAEIHTLYGGQECQVQMSVALDPVDDDLRRCEDAAAESFEAGLAAVRPGATLRRGGPCHGAAVARWRVLEQDAAASHVDLRRDRFHQREPRTAHGHARRPARGRGSRPVSGAANSCFGLA